MSAPRSLPRITPAEVRAAFALILGALSPGQRGDEGQIDELVRGFERGNLTRGARAELEQLVRRHARRLVPEGRQRLRELAHGRGGLGLLREPGLRAVDEDRDPGVRYQEIESALFPHGIEPWQVIQGQLADCTFLSALAGAAAQQPETIRAAIVVTTVGGAIGRARARGDVLDARFLHRGDHACPIFLVRLHRRRVTGRFQPIWVPVDRELPVASGEVAYASARHGLWPALLEKAYAALLGSWDRLGNGGFERSAMEALTGRPARQRAIAGLTDAALVASLQRGLAARQIVVAGSQLAPGAGLVPTHAYTVLALQAPPGGTRWLRVRNPWGKTEPRPRDEPDSPGRADCRDDGMFWLSLAELRRNFATVFFGG